MKKRVNIILLVVCVVMLLLNLRVAAQEKTPTSNQPEVLKPLLVMPFPFLNDSIGSGVGAAVIAEGLLQKQTLGVGSALVSTDGNYLGFLMFRNYHLPWHERLTLEPAFFFSQFSDIQSAGSYGLEFIRLNLS